MKHYAIVGTGYRSLFMFAKRLMKEEYKEHVAIVGIYDINPARAKAYSEECGGLPIFDDFDTMIQKSKPDVVIVTTVDAYHHEYIIRALEAGCDVISEKPMTTDAVKAQQIRDAEKKSGKKVKVTFNMRYMPYSSKIKSLLQQNVVGKVLQVDLHWRLDKRHGADYFRRWHRKMDKSGSLLIHKSTHHFDLINWWLEDKPQTVSAFGDRVFYGPTREEVGERCLTCPHKKSCEFYWDIEADELYKKIYLNCEQEDGYIRDGCLFDKEIDIYDTMALNVKYQNGVMLNYSLIAYSPYESWSVSITGTEGRLEAGEYYSGIKSKEAVDYIKIYKGPSEELTYTMEKTAGSHGGGDDVLIHNMVFGLTGEDELRRNATSLDGAYSMLIGAAANISISEKRIVDVSTLIKE